jgi:hypothetical protein
MSTNGSITNGTAAGPATGSEPLTPEAIAEQLRALRSHVPDFTHLRVAESRALRTAALANPDFVQASINAAGAAANVESLLGKNSSEMRQETEDAGRWTAVEDELRAMLEGVASANLVRRHRIGTAALLTYQVVRRLAKLPQYRYLLPHLEEMKRKNRFGVKRATAPATPPQPPVSAAARSVASRFVTAVVVPDLVVAAVVASGFIVSGVVVSGVVVTTVVIAATAVNAVTAGADRGSPQEVVIALR